MVLDFNWNIILEVFYALAGFLLIACGVMVFQDKENKTRFGGSAFWIITGLIFILGGFVGKVDANGVMGAGIPPQVVGLLVIVLGILSAFKQVNMSHFESISNALKEERAAKFGNKVFIPSIVLALSAMLIAQLLPNIMPDAQKGLGGQIAIGLSAVIGLVCVLLLTRSKAANVVTDSSRLLQQMGPASILPQLLAALGALFTAAGVGNVIGDLLAGIVPSGNLLIGIIIYCIGMALFTIIMGNGFAAFAVITTGIGVPFVIMQGGNPAIVGALGLTAGYCGTLLTPMAANFNIVPANLLETKTQYTIIKYQAPVALAMLAVHIALMYGLCLVF